MRRFVIALLLALFASVYLLPAQNVGIGTATPAEKLHVAGAIRSDVLASPDTNVVVSDVNGTLMNLGPGATNQVLVSQGAGRSPVWASAGRIIETYAASATRTYIPGTSFTQIGGLSQTITLTGNALVQISTYGSLETTSAFAGGSGCIVQAFNNGGAIANAFQTVDVNDAAFVTHTISPWSFTTYVNLPPGTYTIDVRARSYYFGFDPFYAGGNFTAPNPNEGALVLTVFYQ